MRLLICLSICIFSFTSFAEEVAKKEKEEVREISSENVPDQVISAEYKRHLQILDRIDKIR